MANHTIFLFEILTNRGSGFNAGKFVSCEWDDVAEEIKVYLLNDFLDLAPTLRTFGPSLGSLGVDWKLSIDTGYKFCDGTTLIYYKYNTSIFPYAIKKEQLNSIACSVSPVCDLAFDNNPTIVKASSNLTGDGSFTVSATSSHGTIKYSLFEDFDYATQGQTSGFFDNKYGGNYTVYAKDALGCTDSIDILVDVEDTFNVRFFSEWSDTLQYKDHKIEILQRGYAGEVEEIRAAGVAGGIKLNADGEDGRFVIRASEFRFKAIDSENFFYSDLYSDDDREFLFRYYRDDGSGYELRWTGYVNPLLYSEPYIAAPYDVEIIATDGLAQLKDIDFVDESDNAFLNKDTQLNFIVKILKKLDLNLNVQSCVNMLEASMSSGDDALFLTQIRPDMYYDEDGTPSKCETVVVNILREYQAAICQADAKWVIYRFTQTITDFVFNEYDSDGDYVSTGTLSPLIAIKTPTETDRLAWRDRSGNINIRPSYGKFLVRQNLNKKKSLLTSFGFEGKDIVPFGGGTEFFKGWGISINEGAATWGFEKVDRDNGSSGALYVKVATSKEGIDLGVPVNDAARQDYATTKKELVVYSLNDLIEFKGGDKIKFSFDYLIRILGGSINAPWYLFEYKIKIGDYYLNESGNFVDVDPGYLKCYAESINEWGNQEFIFDAPDVGDVTEGNINIYIKINNGAADYLIDDLRAIPTEDLNYGDRRIAYMQIRTYVGIRGYYELEDQDPGTDSLPNIIIPDDYAALNKKAWKLKSSNDGLVLVDSVLLDNVILEYLPGGNETPTIQEVSTVTNARNKRTLEIEIFHGDCPTNIVNAKHSYNNYLMYDPEGFNLDVPTVSWNRVEENEDEPIKVIVLKDAIQQQQRPTRRIQGSLLSDQPIQPYSCIVDEFDSNRLYQMQGYEIEFKENTVTLDIYEAKVVGVNAFGNAFSSTNFGASFD